MNAMDSIAGVGVCTILLVVFIVLKLMGFVEWSWVWVLSPFWWIAACGNAGEDL